MSAIELIAPKEELWTVTYTFPANAPVGTEVSGSVTRFPGAPSESIILVPSAEIFHIMDTYVLASVSPDIMIDVEIDAVAQRLNIQANAFRLDLVSRVYLTESVVVEGGRQLVFKAKNLTAVGAAAVTITTYAKVLKIPIA